MSKDAIASEVERNMREHAIGGALALIDLGQIRIQGGAEIDVDGDRVGEFGYLADLAGHAPPRKTDHAGAPIVHWRGESTTRCRAAFRGYLFQVFLPNREGGFEPEGPPGGARPKAVDPDQAESRWCCYAWPVDYATSPGRVFFVDQSGNILVAPNDTTRYGGHDAGPAPTAAYVGSSMASDAATNRQGSDGQTWNVFRARPQYAPPR